VKVGEKEEFVVGTGEEDERETQTEREREREKTHKKLIAASTVTFIYESPL
jgi:hypothetical protein